MNKRIFTIIIALSGIFILFFILDNNEVYAQSCDGSYMCGQTRELCDCSDGGLCDTAVDGSSCGAGGAYTCSCQDECVFCGQNCGDPIACSLSNGCVIGCGDCWASWSQCTYTPPSATSTPVPSPTPNSMWCGNCDNYTCIFGNPTECAGVGDTDGDGACEGQCANPTNTPGGPTNTPTPANSPHQILGIIKKRNTSEPWYRTDQGACSNDVHEDTSNTMNVRNSNGTGVYDWDCTAAGSTAYHTRASGGGEGPYTFNFTPPPPYDCNQVHWEYSYATCGNGCTNTYVPPDNDGDGNPDYDVDGDGNPNGGIGCTAQLYLGPGTWDNHVHWYIDMDTERSWINGVVTDAISGTRWTEIPNGSCTQTGPLLNCSVCDSETWPCWAEGPHFDLRATTGTCTDCVTLDPAGAGFDTCDYRITTRDCSDIGDASLYSYGSWIRGDCSASLDIPGDCDYQKGVHFDMRNDCSVNLTQANYTLSADETISVFANASPGINEITYNVSDATKVAICDAANTECNLGEGTVTVDILSGSSEIKLTGITIGNYLNILSVEGSHTDGYPCTGDTADVNVENPPAWWQVYGGGVWANSGLVHSNIPSLANKYLINDLVDLASNIIARKGLAAATGSIDNTVSDPENWRAEGVTPVSLTKYDYDHFLEKLGSPASSNIPSAVVVDTLESCSEYRGYRLCFRDGPLEINNGDDSIGDNRIIVLANGDVTLNTSILLNDGIGFLMIIANGDINVDPYFGHFNPTLTDPNLEGIFLAIDDFVTESNPLGDDIHLRIRGVVVGLNSNASAIDEQGVSLERSLGDNSENAAEIFEAAPDLLLRFPHFLSEKHVLWNEVAP